MSAIDESTRQQDASLVAATRIHLGKQSTPPPQSRLNSMVSSFLTLASSSRIIIRTAIAVDPAPKIAGYDLVQAVREAIEHAQKKNTNRKREDGGIQNNDDSDDTNFLVECDLIPVTPWGNFVPALNALTSWALTSTNDKAERILFISAETTLTSQCVEELCRHVDLEDTLVAGVALPGHDYRGGVGDDGRGNGDGSDGEESNRTVVELNGRTCPWNTCAIWNLRKLALTGFPLVADGLHRYDDGSPGVSGIEEYSTILLSQQLQPLSSTRELDFNKAKLVKIPGVEWNQTFEDEERKKWHESKMKSKMARAERHRDLMGSFLKGWVIHC
mmetsp:Transcript_25343/g.29848  ORF Transcript_25343/g.29848 Transcript_25343/m.29848 type:complete len:330 (+) Transcript_25343:30-1019(+)